MQYEEAKKLIEETFENDFDKERFKRFIVNLLKNPQSTPEKTWENNYVIDAFKKYIEYYQRILRFEDVKKRKIDTLIIFVKDSQTFERARTRQRNFVLEYIKREGVDGVLVAYIHSNKKDWRFSFVKLETDIEKDETGKIKDVANITPAKRSSFLVGKNEKSHTAKKQFLPVIKIEGPPRFEDIENAFSVETVTNEFFEKYRELFHRVDEILQKELENKPKIKEEFEKKEIASSDFAKKLLGQIVFLYFLQKKGWFGVKAGGEWGTGPKNFLRELFNRREKYGENFFKDLLEPIFYEALAQDRGTDAIYKKLNNCRMPFLNGGLFEPMHGYTWETTEMYLPNELFSNSEKTKEGDLGNGILDVFDRYNFTVNESDPLEREVAVDPEMLGKVFEKLLDVKDRKSKGAFYTPREIVHYMCQECLINYLDTETGDTVLRKDIEFVVRNGESIIQNDHITLKKQKEKKSKGGKYTGIYELLCPESIRKNARVIDDLLKNIKVCDPAVGSGAFPLGMINEIVGVRQVLEVFLKDKLTTYDFKLHAISNSIYGVDIDPGSVEIARLRLWLSLVVEEDEPSPLPNLEHKIMQGNSLISDYEGIKLFDSELLSKKEEENLKLSLLFGSGSEKKMNELQNKVEEFFSESRRSLKNRLKKEIDSLKWELIEETLKEQLSEGKVEVKNKIDDIKKLKEKNVQPFFIWELEFSEVFREKGGFDVVIGNPPYVGEKKNKEIFREVKKGNLGVYYQGKMDLFYFFFHLALNLGHEKTEVAFITTNYYSTALGARKLRMDLKDRAIIKNLINFNELRIFESAKGQHNMITIFSKGRERLFVSRNCVTKRRGDATEKTLKLIISEYDQETDYYLVKQTDLYDGVENYIRIEGCGTKSDIIQEILNKVSVKGLNLGLMSSITCGCDVTISTITGKHLENFPGPYNKGDGVFVLSGTETEALNLSNHERTLIKSYIKNSDIYKYGISLSDKSLIYLKWEDQLELYPNIKKHLERFKKILIDQTKRYNEPTWPWFALHRPRVQSTFEKGGKILAPYRSKKNNFGYYEKPVYASRDVFFIIPSSKSGIKIKYLLAVLNSKLMYLWLYHRGKRKGEMLELYQKPLSEIPIKKIPIEKQKPFINLANQFLEMTSSPNYDPKSPSKKQKDLEKEINQLVYKLYGLNKEEIEIVERTYPSKE